MGLIGMFNLFSGDFFKDLSLAPKMFLKRKIGIFPHRSRNIQEVKDIFNKSIALSNIKKNNILHPKHIFLNFARKLMGK